MWPRRKTARPGKPAWPARSLGGEQVALIERGDEFAADEQFLQRRAIAQILVVQQTFPEGEEF